LAAIPLTNWPGTIVLAFAMIAYALSRGEWPRILGISALAYAFAIPWIPPSTILTTQADTQKLEPVNQFGWHHLVYVAALAALTYGLLHWFARRKTPRYLRFFVLFLFYM